jgi:Skp family chaperone for outer membrane proteins
MTRRSAIAAALVALVATLATTACNRQGGGLLSLGPAGSKVGYVDLDAVVAQHPLHSQLQAMQDQIALLQQESSLVPTGMTPQQNAAYQQLQSALADAQAKYESDLNARRAYYEQRESQAISQLQATTLGANPDTGGVLGGLQQQFGSQAKAMQQAAFTTLNNYRNELFKQDSDHLRNVQELIAADVRGKLAQKASQLSAAQTAYQVSIVKADQDTKLNLQTKLQDLALTDAERATYSAQLRAIDQAEQTKIDAQKAQGDAEMAAFQKQLNAQAAARYDAERKATADATQAKLIARQKELQTQMQPQLVALNGKFQSQLAAANQKLANNPKYQAQAQSVHTQMQSSYVNEAQKATAAYEDARKSLVARYSAIAGMQFQDNQALSQQADQVAAERRDLYQRIVAQVQTQIQSIARTDGYAVVVTNVRGAGTAVDLTDRVAKALAALGNATASPTTTGSGGP